MEGDIASLLCVSLYLCQTHQVTFERLGRPFPAGSRFMVALPGPHYGAGEPERGTALSVAMSALEAFPNSFN
jgi:hypothetical protein